MSSKPIIELINVFKSFDSNEVISGLNLTIVKGKTTVILGESGSGKSVLIKLMNGLLIPDKGDVIIYGQNTRDLSKAQLRKLRLKVGTMFQNYALLDSMTVAENIAFPLKQNTKLRHSEINKKVLTLLKTLDLPHAVNLFPSELSGGMKKRVSLARTIISNPSVVLFDEPTTGLDPIMIEFVDEMLIDTRERFGITSVVISHDMASVFKLADQIAMLENGKIIFFGSPKEARKSTLQGLRNFIEGGSSRIDFSAKNFDPKDTSRDKEGLSFEQLPKPKTTPVIEIRALKKNFGEREILKGVNLYALPNEITTIIGGSGSGKSVTMKHVLGLLRPTAGSVKVFNQELSTMKERDLIKMRMKFGMLFQSAALFDSMTVEENVMFPLRERPKGKLRYKEARAKAHEVLDRLKIADLASSSASKISSGQRKRVGLARAIVADPDILIYDEPTTGLDPVMTRYVNNMISEAQEAFQITGIVISHDMASTFRISHRVAMLYQGQILAFGTPQELLENDHPRVREFIFAGSFE